MEEVGSHLALVMLPIILGGIAGVTLLEQLSHPSMQNLADAAMPSLPQMADTLHSSDAAALPLIGTLSIALTTTRRTRVFAIIGAVILAGSLAIGVARSMEQPAEAPTIPASTTP